jgi:hypothetical protein
LRREAPEGARRPAADRMDVVGVPAWPTLNEAILRASER